jgi:hypothetical protein
MLGLAGCRSQLYPQNLGITATNIAFSGRQSKAGRRDLDNSTVIPIFLSTHNSC